MRTCDVDGCDKPHRARGLCSRHYNQEHQPDRHAKVETLCTSCGAVIVKHPSNTRRPFCDYACRDLYSIEHGIGAYGRTKKVREPKPPADLRGPLRRALEDGTGEDVIAVILLDCDVRPSGCWEWKRQLHHSGYATVGIAGRRVQVHRLALEARLGAPLGKQQAHHICANSFCVNPDHLQPVTQHDNKAEMMARGYLESRIRDLESALAIHAPEHPLLRDVGISRAG